MIQCTLPTCINTDFSEKISLHYGFAMHSNVAEGKTSQNQQKWEEGKNYELTGYRGRVVTNLAAQ